METGRKESNHYMLLQISRLTAEITVWCTFECNTSWQCETSTQNADKLLKKMVHTDSEADLLLLIGQAIIIVQVKLQQLVLIGQQLHLQAKQDTEVAFTAHHPDGKMGILQVSSNLI